MGEVESVKQVFDNWWSDERRRRFETLPLVQALEEIKCTIQQIFHDCALSILDRAFELIIELYGTRSCFGSGRLLVRHALAVARTLAEAGCDQYAVTAGLLHDVLKQRCLSLDRLASEFEGRIVSLVQAATHLPDVAHGNDGDLESGAYQGLPALLIHLAERDDELTFPNGLSTWQCRDLGQETMDFQAPLAELLGVWELKAHLQDMAFQWLEPDAFKRVAIQLASVRECVEVFLEEDLPELHEVLAAAHIEARIEARVGHVYSTWEKRMRKRGRRIAGFNDLMGARIIVVRVSQCYAALAILHGRWIRLKGEFDDYIRWPKRNQYRSLHTTILSKSGFPLEIQIRTERMHEIAEFGPCAHALYKPGATKLNKMLSTKLSALHLRSASRSAKSTEIGREVRWDSSRDGASGSRPDSVTTDLVYALRPEPIKRLVDTCIGELEPAWGDSLKAEAGGLDWLEWLVRQEADPNGQ